MTLFTKRLSPVGYLVTHNMQQAARVSDNTAFLTMGEDRAGYLVEYGHTRRIFTTPKDQRTEAYITGGFGWRGPSRPRRMVTTS